MGNKHSSHPQTYNRNAIDSKQPFDDLPELWGPLHGYYYHLQDKPLVIDNHKNSANHEIPFIFKYNAVDYENMQKDIKPDNDDENKNNNDDSEHEMDVESAIEFQKYRFEWIYIIPNDNVPYYKVNDSSYLNSLLPQQYANIIDYLREEDPIPPHFLRKSRMADMVFQSVLNSSLRDVKHLKCRIITKTVNDVNVVRIDHPALLLWNGKEEFGANNDRVFCIIHLRKLPKQYESEQDKKENKEQIEIECKPILRYNLDQDEWNYKKYESQDIMLEHGLVDIAHWSLKYEMEHEYKYHQYTSNCRQFMMDLCNAFKIVYDAKNWTDNVCYVAKKSNQICGSWR